MQVIFCSKVRITLQGAYLCVSTLPLLLPSCRGESPARVKRRGHQQGAPLTTPPSKATSTPICRGTQSCSDSRGKAPQGQSVGSRDEGKAASSPKRHILRTRARISLSTASRPVPLPSPSSKHKSGEPRRRSHRLHRSPVSLLHRESLQIPRRCPRPPHVLPGDGTGHTDRETRDGESTSTPFSLFLTSSHTFQPQRPIQRSQPARSVPRADRQPAHGQLPPGRFVLLAAPGTSTALQSSDTHDTAIFSR